MKFDDYVQIKLKKITGEVGGKFESLHFSKRSVLVSVVSDNSRDVFAPQSSFLLGYMCISKCCRYISYICELYYIGDIFALQIVSVIVCVGSALGCQRNLPNTAL